MSESKKCGKPTPYGPCESAPHGPESYCYTSRVLSVEEQQKLLPYGSYIPMHKLVHMSIPEITMSAAFQVGEKVRFLGSDDGKPHPAASQTGEVVRIYGDSLPHMFRVKFPSLPIADRFWNLRADQLQAATNEVVGPPVEEKCEYLPPGAYSASGPVPAVCPMPMDADPQVVLDTTFAGQTLYGVKCPIPLETTYIGIPNAACRADVTFDELKKLKDSLEAAPGRTWKMIEATSWQRQVGGKLTPEIWGKPTIQVGDVVMLSDESKVNPFYWESGNGIELTVERACGSHLRLSGGIYAGPDAVRLVRKAVEKDSAAHRRDVEEKTCQKPIDIEIGPDGFVTMETCIEYAAGSWCDPTTSNRVMDPQLCEVFAKKIKNLCDAFAVQFKKNAEAKKESK